MSSHLITLNCTSHFATLHLPTRSINKHVYDGALEAQMTMIYDSHKKLVQVWGMVQGSRGVRGGGGGGGIINKMLMQVR